MNWLSPTTEPGSRKLACNAQPAFFSDISLVLAEAASADAGVALLPRYLGDASRGLVRIPMPSEPTEALWLTVHRDLRQTPRVRVLFDFLVSITRTEQALLQGS